MFISDIEIVPLLRYPGIPKFYLDLAWPHSSLRGVTKGYLKKGGKISNLLSGALAKIAWQN